MTRQSIKFAFFLFALLTLSITGCKKEKEIPTGGSGGNGSAMCSDGILNGNELAIDCGGPDCPACECESTVTDIDGNVYSVVTIGGQCWMQENLKTLHYNDGEVIPQVNNNAAWTSMTDGAWCFFDNDDSNAMNYGLLYNWYAVNTGKLCPAGWHVPTAEEWETLWNYVDYDGGKLKAVFSWNAPNTGATNTSGFTAVPGGSRVGGGAFVGLGHSAYFYSSSNGSFGNVFSRSLFSDETYLFTNEQPKEFGYSCRCIKDPGESPINDAGFNCVSGNCVAVSSGAQFGTLMECQNFCSNDYLLYKDFSDNSLTSGGWNQYVVNSNPQPHQWEIGNFSGTNPYAVVTGYDGPLSSVTDLWLISPSVNFSGATSPFLSFRNASRFSGNLLQVLISTDYNGFGNPIQQGSWVDVTSNFIWDTNINAFTWTNSGAVSMALYNGQNNVRVAFRYTSTVDAAATWEVDYIIIEEQGGGSSGDNCCDCTGIGFDCDECCEGEFDMLGETWATWEAVFAGSGCNCN